MSNEYKERLLSGLRSRFVNVRMLPESRSLVDVHDGAARVYIRYSKIHKGKHSFYGLRQKDLALLGGKRSYICFLWDADHQPVFLDYGSFEEIFNEMTPASDGQIKVHIYHEKNQVELRLGGTAKFNIEGFIGWDRIESSINSLTPKHPDLSHSQVQTLIGSIGAIKGFNVWIPLSDRNSLDWTIAPKFKPLNQLPDLGKSVGYVANEVDVMWIKQGESSLGAIFEVEHSTPIYSGLLRFNDLLLVNKNHTPRFTIAATNTRRAKFYRQIGRPTFTASGLSDLCNFLDYNDVWQWHERLNSQYAK